MAELRIASNSDIPSLEKLIKESARGLSVGFYSPKQIESAVRFLFGVDTQLIVDRTYYLVEEGSHLVACGGWSKRKTLFGGDQFKEKADPLLNPSCDAARIRAFFVHPEWTRRGIGKMLLDTCETGARCEGFSSLELGSTLPGVPFYSAMGFSPLEESEVKLPNEVTLPIVRMTRGIL